MKYANIASSLTLAAAALFFATPGSTQPSGNLKLQINSSEFEVFCDFRCPFCKQLFAKLIAGERSQGISVDYKFRHFPFHAGSDSLAFFYEAAVQNYPEQREALIDSLYKFQHNIEPRRLNLAIDALGVVHGFSSGRIQRDMNARDVQLLVIDSQRLAIEHGVHSTPTVFYKGTLLEIDKPEDIAKFMIDRSAQRVASEFSAPQVDCSICEVLRSKK